MLEAKSHRKTMQPDIVAKKVCRSNCINMNSSLTHTCRRRVACMRPSSRIRTVVRVRIVQSRGRRPGYNGGTHGRVALMPLHAPVLTIDGPSGSGKGTVSRLIASRLGWHYLDSGAIYRAIGLAVADAEVDPGQADVVAALARRTQVEFLSGDGGSEPRVIVDGEDLTERLRLEASGTMASTIAAIPEVRAALLEKQRSFRRPPGLVADGRDMGTVVFPDARTKVFLTASVEERARRRHKQLKDKGVSLMLDTLLSEIRARDARDASRQTAPLRPADDAIRIDTTGLGVEAVVAHIVQLATT